MSSTKPTKVLIVISNLSLGGGAERVAAWLADTLFDDPAFTVEVLTFYKADESYQCRAPVTSLDEPMRRSVIGKLFRAPGRVWSIKRFCKTHEVDVAVSFLEESNFYLLLSTYIGNRSKTIVSVRNNPSKKKKLYQRLIRWLYPRAALIVPNSNGIAQILQRAFKLTNTRVIYNPIDKDKVARLANEPVAEDDAQYFSENTTKTTFISIGRLIPQKGQWHLVRAFEDVHHRYPFSQLVIFGSGHLEGKLRSLIEDAGLTDSVLLLGKRNNIFPYLRYSDWFVLSSLWEGMPNALQEALATKVPVISTDCKTGPREILLPDTDPEQTLSYPHTTPYGILIDQLSEDELFVPIRKHPLSWKERELAEVMKNAVKGDYKTEPHPLTSFEPERIFEKWKDALHSVLRV